MKFTLFGKSLSPVSPCYVLAFAVVCVSSGCSHQTASSTDGSAKKGLMIGLTVQSTANPYFVSMQNGVEAEGKLVGATTSMQDGQQDIGHQTDIIDDFVQEKVDLILVNAVDSVGIAPAIARARQANIPVVAVDVGAQGGVNATITSDNVQAGRIAAQYMATRLHGHGNIAVIDGPPVTAVQDRDAGLKEVLKKYPGLTVLSTQVGDGSRDKGLQLGVNILTANPHLDAVFTINDPTALGMELAAKQANRSDLFIVSVDGSPDVVKDMKSHGLIAATAAQDPGKLGKMAVQIGLDIAHGKKPAQDLIKLPVTLVTQDNVNGYAGWN